jgi:Ca2+/Na+ antiporter
MRILFKILAIVFCLLFLVSAVLQYNDPDPIIWMLIYVVAMVITILFLIDMLSMRVLLIAMLCAFLGFLYIFPDKFEGFEIGKGDIKNIEEGREAFGLLLMAIAFGLFALGKKLVK